MDAKNYAGSRNKKAKVNIIHGKAKSFRRSIAADGRPAVCTTRK
jgi:hypothetical protein